MQISSGDKHVLNALFTIFNYWRTPGVKKYFCEKLILNWFPCFLSLLVFLLVMEAWITKLVLTTVTKNRIHFLILSWLILQKLYPYFILYESINGAAFSLANHNELYKRFSN